MSLWSTLPSDEQLLADPDGPAASGPERWASPSWWRSGKSSR